MNGFTSGAGFASTGAGCHVRIWTSNGVASVVCGDVGVVIIRRVGAVLGDGFLVRWRERRIEISGRKWTFTGQRR